MNWPTCATCEHVRVDHAPTRRDGVGPKGRGACMRQHCECVGYRSRLADEAGL